MTELVPPTGFQNYHIIIVPSMSAALLASYTPGYAELVMDEDTLELVVGDGSTVGGNYRVGAGGVGGGNAWYVLHIDGASTSTDISPTAPNSQLTFGGLYGFTFATDTVAKKVIGALPSPGPVGESLQSTGAAWVSGPAGGTVFGRALPVNAEEGDYTTDLVSAVAGFNYLNAPVVTPPTDGQALLYSTAASGYVGGASGPGGSGISPVSLLASPFFDITAPPSWVFYNRVGGVSFDATTSQSFFGVMRWPAGSSFAIKILVSMLTATTGTLGFGFQVMKLTPGAAASVKTDSYDAADNLGSATVSTTSNGIFEVNIAVTAIDGAVAGDYVRWKFWRNTAVAGNAAGNAEMWTADLIPTA